jgi:hypothetical protein
MIYFVKFFEGLSMESIENKMYLTKEELENYYGIKVSLQAKLRMEKRIPYVKPAGSKVCLYNKGEIDDWLEEYRVSTH